MSLDQMSQASVDWGDEVVQHYLSTRALNAAPVDDNVLEIPSKHYQSPTAYEEAVCNQLKLHVYLSQQGCSNLSRCVAHGALRTDIVLPLISDHERVFVRKGCICSVHDLHEQSVEDIVSTRDFGDKEACFLMMDVCKALHGMRQLGYRHRNVRLSHIFPSPDGSYLLGGLHFAVSIQDINDNDALTFPQHCRPSPCFSAPEILRGHTSVRTPTIHFPPKKTKQAFCNTFFMPTTLTGTKQTFTHWPATSTAFCTTPTL
jgi:serine/threonine protein kinase